MLTKYIIVYTNQVQTQPDNFLVVAARIGTRKRKRYQHRNDGKAITMWSKECSSMWHDTMKHDSINQVWYIT